MSSERERYLLRGIRGHCPRCDHGSVFKNRYQLHASCPNCSLPLEHEDGWSLGAIPLNYALTCLGWVLPVALLYLSGGVSLMAALILAGIGALILPILGYRFSKALWMGIYYAVLPHEAREATADEKGASG